MRWLILLIFSTQLVLGQKIFESFDLDGTMRYTGTTTYDFDVDVATIPSFKIHKIKGDITIKGVPGMTIHIEEKVRVRAATKLQALNQFEEYRATVMQKVDGNVVEVVGSGHWPSRIDFSYVITTPANISVLAYTSGGDIEIRNITGQVDLKTSGGDLDLSNIIGKLTAKTSGGDIELSHGQGNLFLSTSGGDLVISDTEGKINAHTSGGDIEVNYNLGDVIVSTSGGDIELYSIQGKQVSGRTSGGDIDAKDITAELNIRTSGGDLDIEDIRGPVKASTSGGDIDISNVFGAVVVSTSGGSIVGDGLYGKINARTSGGDIEIEKAYDPSLPAHDITLKNSNGNIYLVLPEEFSGNFDVVVKGSYSLGVIDSEFPITITRKQNEVRGMGTIGSGLYLIKLGTYNGQIVIEKD
ncbi:MAG: DUF4097 family beta strand repeat protein [FCB group bacterium]|nr:DUF4097 family beta strand repeat protein [FCB group bacterium]